MKANYHTHTYLCRHAGGNPSDYAESALAFGIQVLGMSDHAPFRELRDRSVRMQMDELPIYLQECDEAISRYAGKLQIYKGLEIEFFEGHEKYYQELKEKLDYLALGQHYVDFGEKMSDLRSAYGLSNEEGLRRYTETVIRGMESGWFRFVCHPDLMLFGYPCFDGPAEKYSRQIIQASIRFGLPIEINANGIRRGSYRYPEGIRYVYPRLEFWKLAKKMGAKVIISADAHNPALVGDEAIGEAYQFAADLGIEVEEELIIDKH
jgi:histidinol-phosphatase (PHP family)